MNIFKTVRKTKNRNFAFAFFGSVLMLHIMYPNYIICKSKSVLPLISKSVKEPFEDSDLKVILLWNWNQPLFNVECPIRSCVFTTDMSLIEHSDLVVLHFDTLEDFPLNRKAHQRFVFYHFESPDNTASTLMDDPRFRFNYFNWTMTYRRDSDIFLRDYYGSLIAKTSSKESNHVNRYNYSCTERTCSSKNELNTHVSNMTEIIRGKTKLVAWFVNNCFTTIRREEYVRQLSQFLPIDIFGKCTKDCPSNCDEMIRTDYKFYLAFENSWCPDYITEKFSRPLLYGAVPVVLGGADYSKFAPPKSYINAREFDSVKNLADYLILLDKTDALYASYFNWKEYYEITVPDMLGWCELCRMAYDNSIPQKVYKDIKKWWMVNGGNCESNSTIYF